MARIDHDLCTLSIDTSGQPLHQRGFKEQMHAAPLRETLAALFLRQCGFDGAEPVFDPMCGAGTFVIEAAEIAARLNPGRARAFAFERLATFDPEAWDRMREPKPRPAPPFRFHGTDRDAGATPAVGRRSRRPALGIHDVIRVQPAAVASTREG